MVASRVLAGLRRPRPDASSTEGRLLLVLAVALFVGSFVVALRALPDSGAGVDDVAVRWSYLVLVALLAVPATTMANGAEYALTAQWNGYRVTPRQATEVAVLASAGNLLPIPGAVLVRARALRRLGATYGQAVSATAIAGVVWLGTTLVVVGLLLLGADADDSGTLVPVAAVVGGLGALAGSAAGIRSLRRRQTPTGGESGDRDDRFHRRFEEGRAMAALLAVELAAVAIGIVRYAGVMAGLSLDVSVAQAAALTVSVVAASALGFLPGGLGLREVIGAAIAPVVGLPAAVGLLIVAVDRLVGLAMLALMAGVLGVAGGGGDADATESGK